MAAWGSTSPLKAPRFSLLLVSLAKNPSTAFSHDAELGRRGSVVRSVVLRRRQQAVPDLLL